MKIATVIGARPQFIKAATISRAITEYNRRRTADNSLNLNRKSGETSPFFFDEMRPRQNGNDELTLIEEIIVHTGQHYDDDMSAIFFKELEIPEPKYNLSIGSASHGRQTGQMLAAIEEVLLKEKPDWVLVYGDTNSTLSGALAAAKLHIPIAHVEAGLRSYNRLMPEEINRVMTDQLSHLLLCPSPVAVNNLAAEGIERGVVITGDVMADALQFAATKAATKSDILTRLGLHPRGYLLATVHRAENTDDGRRLVNVLSAFAALNEPIVFPVHPRTRKLMKDKGFDPPGKVKLIHPVGYFDMIALEKSARMILTDSGGIQKEAYWLEVPCVTLRDETEWVETVESGWNILSGTNGIRITDTVRTFRAPSTHPSLYGDGKAALHCLKAILESHFTTERGNYDVLVKSEKLA